jgi:NitT/TauT family transport system ATP-binding protein
MRQKLFAPVVTAETGSIDLIDVALDFLATDGVSAKRVLGPLNLCLRRGEHVALLGPNGAGKTTLLKLIARLLKPSIGVVHNHTNASVGFVFQEPCLFPWLSVEENVRLPVIIHQTIRDGNRNVEKMMSLLGLGDYARHMPVELSGGFQARVAFARSLVITPDFLCCDEPFASLDLCSRLELYSQLPNMMRETGTTLIVVSHSVDEALSLAQRIIVLDGPPLKVVWDEQVDDVVSAEGQKSQEERILQVLRQCKVNNNVIKI